MAKRKPMSAQEKKERARIRKELREEGVLPPKKKPLDRKRFVCEARRTLEAQDDLFTLGPYIYWALLAMMERHEWPAGTVSPEAVGAAKVVKLAAARKAFEIEKRGETFTVGELLEAVKHIYEA